MTPASITGPFIAAAAARGLRAPVRLVDQDARAWPVSSDRDALFVDEYGDLWWGREVRAGEVRIVRAMWPEEFTNRADEIARALDRILVL